MGIIFFERIKLVWGIIYKRGIHRGFKEGYKRGFIKGTATFTNLNSPRFKPFLEFYNDVLDFAIEANKISFQKYNPPSKDKNKNILTRSALYRIATRAIELYRSVLSLCENGWSSTAAVILRSLMECLMFYIVITRENSEYWAFRYYANDYLNDLIHSSETKDDLRGFQQQQLEDLKIRLSSKDRKEIEIYINNFLKRTKPKAFWFKPEYPSAEAILNYCSNKEDMNASYRYLSMSTHNTHIGSSLFKDKPDQMDINPKEDKKGIILSLLMAANLLLELTDIRVQFEHLGLENMAQSLREKKLRLKSLSDLVF